MDHTFLQSQEPVKNRFAVALGGLGIWHRYAPTRSSKGSQLSPRGRRFERQNVARTERLGWTVTATTQGSGQGAECWVFKRNAYTWLN